MRVEAARFDEVVTMVREEFPHLMLEVDASPREVDACAYLHQQPGLDFNVSFDLQGDELHLHASRFWCEWFPCDNQAICEEFKNALRGVLSGQYRVREHYVARNLAEAVLEKPEDGRWVGVAVYKVGMLDYIPWWRRSRIVQDKAGQ